MWAEETIGSSGVRLLWRETGGVSEEKARGPRAAPSVDHPCQVQP